MTRIYLAGPLFNTHERWYLERITEALEGAGYTVFLPHRDAGVMPEGRPIEARQRLFRDDVAELNACDVCVALLTGVDTDSGTALELGYMYAQGKPCFGIGDDYHFYLNNMIWGVCGQGARIVKQIDELVPMLRRELQK
jgi:nucleoside 2-deoxyribosyltransferase